MWPGVAGLGVSCRVPSGVRTPFLFLRAGQAEVQCLLKANGVLGLHKPQDACLV
jgi:hypothetical protein